MRRSGIAATTTAVVALLLVGTVAADRHHVLPESVSRIVRTFDGPIVDKLARSMGWDLPTRTAPPPPSGSAAPEPQRRVDWARTFAELDAILVEDERPRGYDRDAWPHWSDADGNCRDARQEVLLAEETSGTPRMSKDGCRIVAGTWNDPYTGQTFEDPRKLDVDHLVPLAEAWRSGGYDWTRDRRAAYANDLSDPRTLIAVDASANRAKGDQGPEEWRPPMAGYLCVYVADWVGVKSRWRLTMDERERVSVGNIVAECFRNDGATISTR